MKDNAFLQARRSLLLDHCFFGSLIMHLDEVEDPDTKKGLWVDGQNVGYAPDEFEKLELREAAGLLAKGVLHCALGHHLRRGDRDQDLWQKACDYVTVPHVLGSGLRLPAGALSDPQYKDMSAEQVYRILEDGNKEKQPGGGDGTGSGSSTPQPQPGQGQAGQQPQPQTGEVRDLPGDGEGQQPAPANKTKQAEEWKINLQQAIMNAQARGDLPASLRHMVETELTPRIDWREELRRFMQAISKDDMSWSHPNRRFIGQGLYLPVVRGEKMGEIVVAVDTSGSIGPAILNAFGAEINAIVEDTGPERTHVVYCDASVQRTDEFGPDELPIKIDALGGGGTNFVPVFDWVEQTLSSTPACLIYLTDTYGNFPQTEPDYPVLWISTGGSDVPFGELVKLELN